MSRDKYLYRCGILDAGKLISSGLNNEVILGTILCAFESVKDQLIVSWTSGCSLDCCETVISFMNTAYSELSKRALELGNFHTDITFILNEDFEHYSGSVEFVPGEKYRTSESHRRVVFVQNPFHPPERTNMFYPIKQKKFPSILFAGTFDHLHHGHKIILTQCVLMATNTLYVAVTSQSLLKRKLYSEAVQSFDIRQSRVMKFVESVRPPCQSNLVIKYLETSDGIALADTLNFDALVITPETRHGGKSVNEARERNGLPKVELVCLDLLGVDSIENKLSSTIIRRRICDNLPGGEKDLRELRIEWDKIMDELKVLDTVASRWWSQLIDVYGMEPSRHYHTLRHIYEIHLLASFEYSSTPPTGLLLATWFHDVVYDPRSTENEADSVKVFKQFAEEASIPKEFSKVVETAIDFTREHLRALSLSNESVVEWIPSFLEMDLAILASDHERYHEYTSQIRAEYEHLCDSEFRKGRKRFLQGFSSFEFRHIRDSVALSNLSRCNLKNEIDLIESSGDS